MIEEATQTSDSVDPRAGTVDGLRGIAFGRLAAFSAWYERRGLRQGRRLNTRLDAVLQALARRYARGQWPMHLKALETILVHRQGFWVKAGWRESVGADGLRLRLNLADFYQRWAYFLGRYHEVHVCRTLDALLRPGDVFFDGGANVGLLTMQAARRAGNGGRVIAVEPNPRVLEQLRWHVQANALGCVVVHGVGLSDAPGTAEIRVPGRWNLGAGTFAPVPARYKGVVSHSATALLVRGDDLCDALPDGTRLVVKLDVEGFEGRALTGLERTLKRLRPAVLSEINPEMLAMSGESAEAVAARLAAHGYVAFSPAIEREWLRWRRLALKPADWSGNTLTDVLWVHPGTAHWERIQGMIRR